MLIDIKVINLTGLNNKLEMNVLRDIKSSKKIRLSFMALFFCIFFITAQKVWADTPSSYEDCKKIDENFLVNLPSDCFGKNETASFKVSSEFFSSCRVFKKKSLNYNKEKFDVVLSAGVKAFLKNYLNESEDFIAVEMSSSSIPDFMTCGDRGMTFLIEETILSAKKEKQYPVLIAEGVYKLTDLPRSMSYFVIEQNGKLVTSSLFNDTASNMYKYNLYFKRDHSGNVEYFVKCLGWNKECHGVSSVRKRYGYKVSFPNKYESNAFDIMNDINAFFNTAYIAE